MQNKTRYAQTTWTIWIKVTVVEMGCNNFYLLNNITEGEIKIAVVSSRCFEGTECLAPVHDPLMCSLSESVRGHLSV